MIDTAKERSFRGDGGNVANSPLGSDATTLVGGAPVTATALQQALAFAPRLVAADGGANHLRRLGVKPEMVIGDLDSISRLTRDWLGPSRLRKVFDPDTTDFEKAIEALQTPFILAVGFSGSRVDHGLAALNALVRNSHQKVLLLSGKDVIFVAPPQITLDLPVGTRFSLFPMGVVRCKSRGLRWGLDQLSLAPSGKISTSNETSEATVSLTFDTKNMLLIMPRRHLRNVLVSLQLLSN